MKSVRLVFFYIISTVFVYSAFSSPIAVWDSDDNTWVDSGIQEPTETYRNFFINQDFIYAFLESRRIEQFSFETGSWFDIEVQVPENVHYLEANPYTFELTLFGVEWTSESQNIFWYKLTDEWDSMLIDEIEGKIVDVCINQIVLLRNEDNRIYVPPIGLRYSELVAPQSAISVFPLSSASDSIGIVEESGLYEYNLISGTVTDLQIYLNQHSRNYFEILGRFYSW